MKLENQKYHLDVLSLHQAIMFETLVHQENIISDTVKVFTFEDKDSNEIEPLKGYLAVKEIKGTLHKYFIEEKYRKLMPLRMNNCEELYLKESTQRKAVVFRPLKPTPFRINPEQTFINCRTMVDELCSFEHTNPAAWTMMKLISIIAVISKTFLGISTPSEFGKSSIFNCIHGITQKSIVYQPRSEAGVLIQINEDGNMIFDEACDCDTKVKRIIGKFTLKVADNSPTYVNGAVKATYLKQIYDITKQSITFIYNLYNYYKNPDDDFFDKMFPNNPAIHSRMLKLKFDGTLTENFSKDFDMHETAEQNKMYYIKVVKYLLWLKQLRAKNAYERRYKYESQVIRSGRKKLIYDELSWIIDIYCESEREYQDFIMLLDKSIIEYKEMVTGHEFQPEFQQALEENIE